LCEALVAAGHVVLHELDDGDIDILLMMDPRWRSPNITFAAARILQYLAMRNPRAIAVHRVNECDERKGEPFINHKLIRANYVADVTVFVGAWLTRLPVWQQNLRTPWFVVYNGADRRVFNANGFTPWTGEGQLKLVTHHWGYHPYKGFDVYSALDAMLDDPQAAQRFAFTYVGNLPKGFRFRNVRYVPPLDGEALAAELRSHHAYITGSIGEPGGNHQNEGALCGLPLVFRNSGCMPEYCEGFGLAYEGPADVREALNRLRSEYLPLAARMASYPHTAEQMTRDWLKLLEQLHGQKDEIVAARRLWRAPARALACLWPL
jgi:hypothetical protein